MIARPSAQKLSLPTKLNGDKCFQPCPPDEGEEAFLNAVSEFNITRLLAHIDAHPDRFALEEIAVNEAVRTH